MPGSQTEIALVTADFVKIYDLSVDKISPIYYFLLPMGKVKDVTFVYDLNRVRDDDNDNESSRRQRSKDTLEAEIGVCRRDKYIVIMTSCGHLYYEMLSEHTAAKNGVYYVTSVIEFNPTSAASAATNETSSPPPPPPAPSSSSAAQSDKAASQLGGGVSVYYSFKMQLLFWSYSQGKTYIGSLKPNSLVLLY